MFHNRNKGLFRHCCRMGRSRTETLLSKRTIYQLMKKFLLLTALVIGVSAISFAQEGTSRDFWRSPVRVQSKNILPKPVDANSQLGYVNGAWGTVVNPTQFGTVVDTCDATGLVVVPATVASATYQVFVTPIATTGLHPTVPNQTDYTLTVKLWLNDTAANAVPVQFYWLLHE